MQRVIDAIQEILERYHLPIQVTSVSEETEIQKELGLDSLLLVQLALALSEIFNIPIDDCRIEEWETVKDIFNNMSNIASE